MNARYQKNTEPKGQTRKSSAAAKPSRKSGSTSSSSSSKSKSTKRSVAYIDPQTPEFKGFRRMWWISLGSGLALVAVSFGVRTYFKTQPWANAVGGVTLVLAYAAIFYALYLDWAKMRPLRKGQSVGATKSQKTGKADVSDSHGEPTAKTSNPSSDDTTSTAEKS